MSDYLPNPKDTKVAVIPLNETNITNPFNMTGMNKLNPIPAGLILDQKLNVPFTFTLADEFLKQGDPQIQSILGYYNDTSLKSIQFTFFNGNTTSQTKLFGVSKPADLKYLTKQVVKIPANTGITASSQYFLNHTAPVPEFGGSSYATINYSVNSVYTLGPATSKVAGYRFLQMEAIDSSTQYIVGVSGYTNKATGELLGVELIYASKFNVVFDPMRLCMREYGFLIKNDLTLLDPLALADKISCYGLSAQGRFGDNNTPAPDVFDLVENIKWNNWMSYKGMDKQVAKRKWLELVEPLILKKGFSKCKWP